MKKIELILWDFIYAKSLYVLCGRFWNYELYFEILIKYSYGCFFFMYFYFGKRCEILFNSILNAVI